MSSYTIPNDVDPKFPLIVVNLTNIINLTNFNYLSLKLKLEAILVAHGLFKFLEDPTYCLPPLIHLSTPPESYYFVPPRQIAFKFPPWCP